MQMVAERDFPIALGLSVSLGASEPREIPDAAREIHEDAWHGKERDQTQNKMQPHADRN